MSFPYPEKSIGCPTLKSDKSVGTVIDAVQVEKGPPAIESKIDEAMAGPEILRLVKEAEDHGCNAAIIWCGSDPAIEASRQLVDIPVIGPGEAMEAISVILGKKPAFALQGRLSFSWWIYSFSAK